MNDLEQDLREELSRRVAAVPPLPHLSGEALRRGRAARRRRRAVVAAAGAGVVALAFSATSWVPSLPALPSGVAAAPLEGPPRVPLLVSGGSAEVLDWPEGVQRSRPLADGVQPVAAVPGGLLVVTGGDRPALALLSDGAGEPRPLVPGLAGRGVAVSDDGRLASVVVRAAYGRQLQEVETSSGRLVRSVILAPPTFGRLEPVQPVAYSGAAVLLTVGEAAQQRSLIWEGNDDQVVGNVEGVLAAVGGGDAGFSDDRDALGGRAAFTVRDSRCGIEVHELRNGDGNPWKLCRETFVGFSPDGSAVLATDAARGALVVHDADGGDVRRTFEVPTGVRASGWESEDTVLYATVTGPRTVVVRCSIDRGACATAVELPYTDRIPQPLPSR